MPDTTPTTLSTPTLGGYIQHHAHGSSLHVWCSWCCQWHEHGLAGAKVGDIVHRIAHCYADDSTYRRTGYRIVIVKTPFSEVSKSMRTATSSQRQAIQDGRSSEAVRKLRDQRLPII
ncbi:hypothetical protein [Streptomyces sp. NPDC002176]|uniref:hypothetical protein n=1 Tax=Streptomyces sp. NPDC002176 TaxID=3364634 RepID=UPI00384BF43B